MTTLHNIVKHLHMHALARTVIVIFVGSVGGSYIRIFPRSWRTTFLMSDTEKKPPRKADQLLQALSKKCKNILKIVSNSSDHDNSRIRRKL